MDYCCCYDYSNPPPKLAILGCKVPGIEGERKRVESNFKSSWSYYSPK